MDNADAIEELEYERAIEHYCYGKSELYEQLCKKLALLTAEAKRVTKHE